MKIVPRVLALLSMTLTITAQADSVRESEIVPVENLKWIATGLGPLMAAPAYGDMSKGGHGTFIKFPQGYVTPAHTHTAGYRAIVVSGTMVNSEEGHADVNMQAGSYWSQKGKHQHVTKCISNTGCVVFMVQADKFDQISVK
ncbi:MAG: DUF4437 domain-containing protein [Burkholderiales bacterium]|nr:DUF4437 domain-containing protein [Burkholderiales bacterium]MBI3729206.1 DUF4437 domain-containing protein [Burkholderiales bacterium]